MSVRMTTNFYVLLWLLALQLAGESDGSELELLCWPATLRPRALA